MTIIGGDFNTIEAPALRETVDLFGELGFAWSSEHVGATARFAVIDVQTDHIFARGMPVTSAGQISTAQASDHKPIWVRFSMETNATEAVSVEAVSAGAKSSDSRDPRSVGANSDVSPLAAPRPGCPHSDLLE